MLRLLGIATPAGCGPLRAPMHLQVLRRKGVVPEMSGGRTTGFNIETVYRMTWMIWGYLPSLGNLKFTAVAG